MRPERLLLLLLVVAVLLPMAPLVTGGGALIQHDIWISDLLHSQLPYKAFLGQQLARGRFPLWMPDIFSGVPFLAQLEAGGLYLPHWPLFALLEPFRALGLALALDRVVAAVGAWLLARRLGASAAASLLAGVSFAWCGFMVTHGRHLNMHAAGALLPWIMWALEGLLATSGRRGGPVLALLLGAQLAAGHPQITWLTGLAMGLRWLFAAGGDWRGWLRSGAVLALATALGGALLAVQLLPAAAFTRDSLAVAAPTWEYASAYPFALHDLWAFAWPPAAGAMESFDHPGGDTVPWGNYGYAGLLPLLLAPLGLVQGPASLRIRLAWGSLALLALLVVLGPHTPVYRWLWELVPGATLFRFPTRFLVLVDLGLAVLGSLGLAALVRQRSLVAAGLAVLTLGELSLHQGVRFPVDDREHWEHPTMVAQASPDRRLWVLDELGPWEQAFLEARGFEEGFEPYRRAWQLPLGSAGVLHGRDSASGYARMVHVRTAAFWQPYNRGLLPDAIEVRRPTRDQPLMPASLKALLDRAAVATLVSPWPVEGDQLDLALASTVRVYRRQGALPRAYLAATWHLVGDLRQAADWMLRDGLDQPQVPALEGGPPPPAGQGLVRLRVEEPRPSLQRVDLPPGHPGGLVVVADSWDRGWSAEVDGEPASLLVVNGYQRGVIVDPEARQVVLRYWPAGLAAGLGLSSAAGALLLAWALLALRGRRST